MKVLIAGDYVEIGRVERCVKAGEYGRLFDTVKPVVESADYALVNLEFPIVLPTSEAKPKTKDGPCLRGSEQALDALAYAGFGCCTLANNHILDQGEECCMDTKIVVERKGLDAVGVGKNREEASAVLYKKIGAQTLAIINCCEKEFSIADENSAGANHINPIRIYYQIQEARRQCDYVIVITHGGVEQYQLPTPAMQERFRFFVDAGADAVVNHHQHCFSGYERYKNALIFYGLGNFCFDNVENKSNLWSQGYLLELDLSDIVRFNIYPYNQCRESAGVTVLKTDDDEYKSIMSKVEQLNGVINDSMLLCDSFNSFADSSEMFYNSIFSPFGEMFLWNLKRVRLLNCFLSLFDWVRLMDAVACESHYERLIRVIARRIGKR